MGYGVAMPTKCYTHWSAEDRETWSLGLAHGYSLRRMANVLGRSPSTISRESARNSTRGRPYRACTAQTLAGARACQPRRSRTLVDPWLWQYVQTQLMQGCSPEQIAGRLRHASPDDMRKHLSTETIYAALMCCPAVPCAASGWPHCVRRARRADLEREGRIDAVRSPI